MLESLLIENVALIERVEMHFAPGLNILSGETGAGKSILIDSLNFVLGERADKDFIRTGQETASVSAVFSVSEQIIPNLNELGVDIDEDFSLILSRQLNVAGKTSCRINGRPATIKMLKDVSGLLIDIHGQHQHQSLLDSKRHLELLDSFCEPMVSEREQLKTALTNLRQINRELSELGNGREREARVDLLRFQINEIAGAKLSPGEGERLNERKKRLQNAEKILKGLGGALECLSGDNDSAIDLLSNAQRLLESVCRYEKEAETFLESVSTAANLLADVSRDMDRFLGTLDLEPGELDEIESRLHTIYLLKRKYGDSVDDILSHLESAESELSRIDGGEATVKALMDKVLVLENQLEELCGKLTIERKRAADIISKSITNNLKDLGMEKSRFAVDFQKREDYAISGSDIVEFLISPNPGEPLKPLAKIASGGEMSRIMLALKCVLADCDPIASFVFDEIDTGVSGRTAQMVAQKLAILSRDRQVLCISHLPQIAAMGDHHFYIEKRTEVDRTSTYVTLLDTDQIILELARLNSGLKVTEATVSAACEMKEMATEFKISLK